MARNEGLKGVETELVAFLDSDTVPPAGWIEQLAGHFDDPKVAAVAPRIRASEPAAVAAGHGEIPPRSDLAGTCATCPPPRC